MKIAPIWKRMVAFAIDILIVVTLYSLLIAFLNWGWQIPVEYSIFEGRGITVKIDNYVEENFIKLAAIYLMAKLFVIVPYFVLLESSRWQATIGKKLLRIKVENLIGGQISVGKAFLRTVGKFISGQILLIGYLMAFFTKQHRTLHDFLAGTLVFEATNKGE